MDQLNTSADTSTKSWHNCISRELTAYGCQKKPTFIATDIDCYFHYNSKKNSKKHVENNDRLIVLWEQLHTSFGLRLFWESNVNRANLQTLLFAHDMQYLRLLFDTTQKVQNGAIIPVLKDHGSQRVTCADIHWRQYCW